MIFAYIRFKDVGSRTSHKRSGAGSGASTGDSCGETSSNTGAVEQNIDGPVKGGLAGLGMDCFTSENETHANCCNDTTPESYGKDIMFPNFFQNWEIMRNPGVFYS